ncbi:EF-hand domain-containing family member C2-like isoform X2 [Haliotis rubra]|uniref:EF-hand domain-containing family member C2-like isoform X2 n=1 Tax=Haliotis rubra TaxID=36100 RepID=UPI001EE58596|nr:EF-hand domain-containing family member C2-like isoform X2 [Haliotis rubra]
MALPFLPGNSFTSSMGKTKYHKSHHFDNCNDVSMLVGHEKPGIGGEPLLGQKLRPKNSVFPSGEGTNVPAWVAFDRQVLCFDAFFQEAVHEKREEQFRIRNCKIYFYLEDDSIQVIEPRIKNGGVPQGTLIRRHRVPKPPPHDDVFYTVEDFNIGVELNLYSKVFKITGSDEFTQNFLRKLGVRINGPSDIPTDPYVQHRKAMDESMQPLRPYEKHDTLKQFLDHDRHVLRFYCYWDDSDNMFGDPREMILHYFLADDTIEIRECIPPNSGRDAVPVFVRRGKLPKDVDSLKQPGTVTDRTVLNVFGPTGHGGRYILDSLKTGAVHTEFYKDTDLSIGSVLNVWGRKFLLTDCDQFTQEYYKTKYGIEEFSPISYKQTPSRGVRKTFPPFNGFGSEEDSLCSCMGLMPKPPKRDFIKFMEKDRHGLDSNVLRFLGRMNTSKPIDMDRRFIISYFLSDDSVLVFEPPVRNSGIIGGKFLERGRVKKPGQEPYSTEISSYYTAQDLFVGASVEFNKFKFILIDADEYAFRYMEEHPAEFPIANVKAICQKVSSQIGQNKEDIRAFFARNDSSGNGIVSYEQFSGLLRQIDSSLTEHEIMTVARYYSEQRPEDAMDHLKLVAIIQEQLRKRNFEGFGTLVQSFLHADKEKSGFLDVETIRTVFHAHHVPLPDDLLRAGIASAPANESGLILYEEFVKQINWRDFPVPPMQFQPVSEEADWAGTAAKNAVNAVNYQAMLSDVFGSS